MNNSLYNRPARDRRQSEWAGFSLIEALIALTILTILAFLFIPAWSHLRSQADLILCSQNLRSLATAGLQFATDHNGYFTSNNWINHTNQIDSSERLRPGLREYLDMTERITGKDTIFTCPALQKTYRTTGFAFNHNYVLNSQAVNNPSKADNGSFFYSPGQVGFLAIPMPERMMYFMDGVPGSQDDRGYYFSTTVSPTGAANSVFPHGGKNNLVYLNARVDRLSAEQLGAIPANDPFWRGGKP